MIHDGDTRSNRSNKSPERIAREFVDYEVESESGDIYESYVWDTLTEEGYSESRIKDVMRHVRYFAKQNGLDVIR